MYYYYLKLFQDNGIEFAQFVFVDFRFICEDRRHGKIYKLDFFLEECTYILQTKELEDFKNLTEKTSVAPTFSQMSTTNYTTTPDCTTICVPLGGNMLKSDSLIEELAHNISSTALPKLTQIANFFYNELLNITESENNTYSTEFLNNDYITDNYNVTYMNDSFLNSTYENITEFNINDLTYSFIDYLTSILHSFVSSNVTVLTENIDDTTTFASTTEFSTSDFSTADGFQNFKSTVTPFIDRTVKTTEMTDIGRFDNELSTIYDEIMSSISSIKENCTKTCPNITSVVPYNPDQNMNYTMKARLGSLCWETMFGQELIRLTVMDLVMTVVSTLAMDFFRGIFVRVMNR